MSGGFEDRIFDAIHDALTDPTYLEVQGATDRVLALLAETQPKVLAEVETRGVWNHTGGWDCEHSLLPADVVLDQPPGTLVAVVLAEGTADG